MMFFVSAEFPSRSEAGSGAARPNSRGQCFTAVQSLEPRASLCLVTADDHYMEQVQSCLSCSTERIHLVPTSV